MFPTFYINCI